MNKLILYCRVGFEKECLAEITDKANELAIHGFAQMQDKSGYVVYHCYAAQGADKLAQILSVRSLIFARQFFVSADLLQDLPSHDRISPITALIKKHIIQAGELRVEMPDTSGDDGLSVFCRKFTVPLRQTLRKQGVLSAAENNQLPVIHLFFIDHENCYVGYSYPMQNSPYLMGILRLKLPSDAPSRSTLKLEEAFHLFIPANEWETRLAGGMYAVDLGAAPGGWTYQLVKRSMWIAAVDNGTMDPRLMESGQVRHYKDDAFKFEPRKHQITWLVCDVVDKPSRVTELIIKWLAKGWCQETIFNLKLPMKKRYESVKQNIEQLRSELAAQQIWVVIQAKQLYHDREEITVHVQRLKPQAKLPKRVMHSR